MKRASQIQSVSFAAATALGLLLGLPGTASAGGLHIDINLGVPTPPAHHDVVVMEYDSYCVGYRHNLYDADWRLRNAQIEQWHAQEALDAARGHEGEIAVTLDDQEAFVAENRKRVAENDAAMAAARAAVGRAADDAADAQARLHAFEKRIAGAKDDRDAARTLHDAAALEDAEHRIHTNEAAAAQAQVDLTAAEARMGDLRAAEAIAAELHDVRIRLTDADAHLPGLRADLAAAHDDVFAAQQRLDAAMGAVALALHDRDEALWLLHRDEILGGGATFASCGFTIDLNVWGGHMPRDPEVVHLYFVHPVTYWVERPVEIQTRVIECDRIVEISRVRTIQEKHEGPRFKEVATFEARVPAEKRREFAEHVVVERQRLTAERTERASAAAEHRPVRIPETERTEARAVAVKAHPELRTASNAGRAEVNKAKADARADKIEGNAEVNKAKADARTEKIEGNAEVNKAKADARSEEIKAQGDARAEKTEARGAASAEETKARADAKSKETGARADAKAKETEARANANAKETEARADAKAKETNARADAKSDRKTPSSSSGRNNQPTDPKNTSRNAPKTSSEPTADASSSRDRTGNTPNAANSRASGDSKSKDPRNKPKDGQASVDTTK